MTTALAVADTVDATLVPTVPDPLDSLLRYTQVLAAAKEFAEYICVTPMVPAIYQGKAKHATVAILHGAELGLNPLQSLQQIFTVHGMPAIYARTMVALLKGKGFRFRTVEAGPTRVVITGTSPDGVETETSEWTIERADEAGYVPKIDPETGVYAVNKNGRLIGNEKYITEPENMLWAKAAATVCRRLAPDVLLGISRTVEDIESEPEPVRVQSERLSAAEVTTAPAEPTEVKKWAPPTETDTAPAPQDETPAEEAAPADPPMTRVQQKKVGRLFAERGITEDAAILSAIGAFLDRELAAPADVTRGEAIRLLEHLENDPVASAAQVTRVRELLAELHITDDGDRLAVVAHIAGRAVGDLGQLTSAEADAVGTALADKLAGLDESAGGAE
ncbi:hypothetical protein ATM97_06965 [Nocardia sp. MH4]|uniref:hypothetical protein n=1 Tax=Nocardia sp. MH4 TaxID=1768677 RepID=UPI001C4F8A6F|nr:hypothetical protein [Nocardia sp. MH4]MBW0270754.1 hypothetical protein [Nocardia sp. MH4]